MKQNQISRRLFLAGVGASFATAGCKTYSIRSTTQAKSGYKSPNEKLNIAGIGVGGKGRSDVDNCSSENIVALCDVDWRMAGGAFNNHPRAKRYHDFRKMLDECKEIDAVTISTPDHMHAIAAMRCMEAGKHIYVQKPLTHTVQEARLLRETAHRYGVATQMGNQGAATHMHRELCELVWSGIIGRVREVHSWTNRPIWPQGIKEPLPEQPVPDNLDWDLWLGPASYRPYNPGYCPFKWRGWWDFGTGALGDIACHSLSPVVKALRLKYPDSVECIHIEEANPHTYPTKSIIRYHFPKREKFDDVYLYWYDGELKPELPIEVINGESLLKESGGTMFVGTEGLIVMNGRIHKNIVVMGNQITEEYEKPEAILPRLPHIPGSGDSPQDADRMHKLDWILSCKSKDHQAGSNFDHAGPLTEWVLMGNLSLRYPKQILQWDGEAMRFTNKPEANQYVRKDYRKGWELI